MHEHTHKNYPRILTGVGGEIFDDERLVDLDGICLSGRAAAAAWTGPVLENVDRLTNEVQSLTTLRFCEITSFTKF